MKKIAEIENYEEFVKDYLRFMGDEKNIRNCECCPDNKQYDDYQDRLPCEQWHCHVALVVGNSNKN